MRIPVAVLTAALALGIVPGVMAFAADPPKEDGRVGDAKPAPDGDAAVASTREAPQDAKKPTRAEQLDSLFEMLRTAKNQSQAESTETMIAALWLKSGSDTVDLLMDWAQHAVKDKNYPLALDYLDRILTLKPDYVEGWNTRATVYYLREDYGRALADIEKTLEIEPRHFGALTGLGTILREMGDDKRALEVYRKVIALDPHLDSVQKEIDELSEKGVDGRNL
ncbi:MAG TPA: tetratricopeptide repeat protein [Bauldia sp.]|nr:tetratricopeptide repeat protein [Bauldia sp.]